MEKLTKKERIVYETICKRGITKVKDIAKVLNISDNTVKTHIYSIYEKSELHSIADLIYRHWTRQIKILIAIIRKEIDKQ